jgi:hypothetical protein
VTDHFDGIDSGTLALYRESEPRRCGMDSIVSRLFGREAGALFDLITGESDREREMADRAERSGEWCGSTPGHVRPPRPGGRERRQRPSGFPLGRLDESL